METPLKSVQLICDLFFFSLIFTLGFLVVFSLCKNGTGKSKRTMSGFGRIVFAMKLSKFAVSPHGFEV